MLRGSLCREGPKAQEWRLWKPPVLRTKFWIQFIGLQKTTMDVEGWQVAKSATIAAAETILHLSELAVSFS